MAYTDEGKVEKYLAVDIDTTFSAQVTSWIASVKAWIDAYCGKTFESASETRYYDVEGDGDELLIDDFVGSATVTILNADGSTQQALTEGAGTDFVAYPLNETVKNRIVLMPENTIGAFPSGKRRVKVEASFGYSSSVPSDIELAATMLVAKIVEKGLKGGKIDQEILGDYQVTLKDIDEVAEPLGIYNILDRYRDYSI